MNKIGIVAGVVACLFAGSVSAGGGGGMGRIVYDPTNHGENLVTAAKSTAMASTQAEQYAVQVKQLIAELRHLQKLGDGDVAATLSRLNNELQTYNALKSTLDSLHGNLTDEKQRLDYRITDWNQSGLTWEAYNEREKTYIQNKYGNLRLLWREEANMMDHTNQSYERIKQLQKQIPANDGIQQSLGTLNQYMDLVVGQNAMAQRIMIAKSHAETEDEVKKAAEEEKMLRIKEAAEAEYKRNNDEAARYLNEMGGLKDEIKR